MGPPERGKGVRVVEGEFCWRGLVGWLWRGGVGGEGRRERRERRERRRRVDGGGEDTYAAAGELSEGVFIETAGGGGVEGEVGGCEGEEDRDDC